jgi:hypothetical protein
MQVSDLFIFLRMKVDEYVYIYIYIYIYMHTRFAPEFQYIAELGVILHHEASTCLHKTENLNPFVWIGLLP